MLALEAEREDYGYSEHIVFQRFPRRSNPFGPIAERQKEDGDSKMSRLELVLMAGDQSKTFLGDLEALVERMEAAVGASGVKKSSSKAEAAAEPEEEEDDFAKKPGGKKGAKGFDEDEDDAPAKKSASKKAADFGSEEEAEEPAPKKGKAKKLTVDDVNDACKAHAGRHNRAETLALLKKKFKVSSVTELEPEDYEACIEAMSK